MWLRLSLKRREVATVWYPSICKIGFVYGPLFYATPTRVFKILEII